MTQGPIQLDVSVSYGLPRINASGTLLATNNDWKDSQESAISGTKLQPSDDHEAAIYIQLHGGAFTAIVRGQNGTTGTAVVEVYNFQ